MKTRRNSGNAILAVICIIALGVIVYVGYKLIQKLMDHPIDPLHGQGTNALDVADNFAVFQAQHPDASVVMSGSVLPLNSLTQNWYYAVETSTNLRDWTPTDLDWPVSVTNYDEPSRFWRLKLIVE